MSARPARFHIVSVGRNTGPFVADWIHGALDQDFRDYAVTWVDDASTDNAAAIVAEMDPGHVDLTMVLNSKRVGGLANTLRIVRAMHPDDVAILCSADDSLAGPNVLTRVKQEYNAGALLTYGQFRMSTGEPGFCRQMTELEHETPYDAPWVTSHLITFKAWLMQAIDDDVLRDEDGDYYQTAGDQAFMLDMLTMIEWKQAHFIPDVLLTYNRHEGNDDAGVAAAAEARIRTRRGT